MDKDFKIDATNVVGWAWVVIKKFRYLFLFVAIISSVTTFLGLVTVDFFDHRQWSNERMAEKYERVEQAQGTVASLSIVTIPSKSNRDQFPSNQQLELLRDALIDLQTRVTEVDVNSSEIEKVGNEYRASIAGFISALSNLRSENPQSFSTLLVSADRWDKAAKNYSDTVENRINSFSKTLLPST